MYDLGLMIKSLRKERKMTQKKLGDLLGVGEATVCKYESNMSTPSIDTLRSMARLFCVSMDTLCGMENHGTISTYGLTESQNDTVKGLIEFYRIKNSQKSKQLSSEQFAVLGKITAELTK